MDSSLSALVGLGAVIGLIAIGIRVSLYLFVQDAEKTPRLSHRMSLVNEPFPSPDIYTVRHPRHRRVADKAFSSTRYAWHTLIVIALFSVMAIMAIVAILSGIVH